MSKLMPPPSAPQSTENGLPRARERSQRASFALCVAAAFVLNAIAVGGVTAVVARWQRPSLASSAPLQVTAVAVETAARQPTPAAVPLPAPAAGPATAHTPPPTAHANANALAAPNAPAPKSDNSVGDLTHFYSYREVDRPAEPDSDWNLDPAALDAAGVEKLVFEIFVDRVGAVVGCAILEPATLDPQVRSGLEQRLSSTTLQPAILGGTTVPSVRRIEMSVLSPSS